MFRISYGVQNVCVISEACVATTCFSASKGVVVDQRKNQFTFVQHQQRKTATGEPCHEGIKSRQF